MKLHQKGDTVHWRWGHGTGEGRVVEVHPTDITKTLKSTPITRHGSEENPAYLIKRSNGAQVLKLQSELID